MVPALTPRVREAIGKMTQAPLMTVGPGLKSGVRIRMDNPAQLGGELLCAVVAALRLAQPPLIVMNLDTAATMLAVDAGGSIVGGAILPGPGLALDALVRNTAQLPQVELETSPKALFGANTADSLHSGIVNGTAAMLDGMAARFAGELGRAGGPGHCHRQPAPKHPRRLPHPHPLPRHADPGRPVCHLAAQRPPLTRPPRIRAKSRKKNT